MKNKFLVIAFLTCLAAPCKGQCNDAFTSTLDAIAGSTTAERTMSLRNSADADEAAEANRLAPMEVGLDHVWGANGIGNKTAVTVSQSFDWPGVYSARSKAAIAATLAADWQLISLKFDTRLDAKLKLMELVYVRRQLQLLRQVKENTDSLQVIVEKGYRGGELTILDTKKITIEQYKLCYEIDALEASESALTAEIQALRPDVELPLDSVNAYPAQQMLTLDQFTNLANANNYAAKTAAQTARAELLNAKAARQSRLPGFSVGYQYQREMGDTFNGFTFGLTLPFQGKKTAKAAASRAQAAELEHEQILADARKQTEADYAQLNIWSDHMNAYQQTIGDGAYLTLLMKAYRGGQLSVIDYISETLYFLDAQRSSLEGEYNYNTTLARLLKYE